MCLKKPIYNQSKDCQLTGTSPWTLLSQAAAHRMHLWTNWCSANSVLRGTLTLRVCTRVWMGGCVCAFVYSPLTRELSVTAVLIRGFCLSLMSADWSVLPCQWMSHTHTPSYIYVVYMEVGHLMLVRHYYSRQQYSWKNSWHIFYQCSWDKNICGCVSWKLKSSSAVWFFAVHLFVIDILIMSHTSHGGWSVVDLQ